jgi:hypothetical protein
MMINLQNFGIFVALKMDFVHKYLGQLYDYRLSVNNLHFEVNYAVICLEEESTEAVFDASTAHSLWECRFQARAPLFVVISL